MQPYVLLLYVYVYHIFILTSELINVVKILLLYILVHTYIHIYICVGIYMLRAGRYWNRIPMGAKFSAPVQTGPGAHPTSYTIGTVSFPGVKRPGRGINHPPTSSAKVKKE
jgi:hypothetical protein